MNTFQLLKSGTSFKKDRIEKVQSMFNKPEPKQKRSKSESQIPEEDDELVQIEKQLEALKQSKPKDLKEFNQ